jgi:hypothetical protein
LARTFLLGRSLVERGKIPRRSSIERGLEFGRQVGWVQLPETREPILGRRLKNFVGSWLELDSGIRLKRCPGSWWRRRLEQNFGSCWRIGSCWKKELELRQRRKRMRRKSRKILKFKFNRYC